MNKSPVVRYRHHFLENGAILTICSELDHNTRNVRVGWSCWNPDDKRWVKRDGNKLAISRMNEYNYSFTLSESEPILCDYISIRALQVIFVNSRNKIKSHTRAHILFEIYKLLAFLAKRYDVKFSDCDEL